MRERPYSSPVGHRLADYVALRRSLGFELRSQAFILHQFDRVLRREMTGPGPVKREMVESYLRSLDGLQPLTRRVRLSTVRQFLRYLSQFEPLTFIPDRFVEPAKSSPRAPYIYTDEELRALLREALRFPVRFVARRWLLYHTLIGFLYATGMRISEALALTLADFDSRRAVVHIRKTKFHKARYVPVTRSTAEAIRRYLTARAERGCPTLPSSPLFVSEKGSPLPYGTARVAFRKIARMAQIRGVKGGRAPRVHDLRHTAAVRRLSLWYHEGKDVQALLPALVTYLGHSAVRCTEVYLTATPELLEAASARFEDYFKLDEPLAESSV
jgi:integrase/recombinase XerD